MGVLSVVGKGVWGLGVSLWWKMAGLVLLVFVIETTPWVIEHSEKTRWLPLAYLIWGCVGAVALILKHPVVIRKRAKVVSQETGSEEHGPL